MMLCLECPCDSMSSRWSSLFNYFENKKTSE